MKNKIHYTKESRCDLDAIWDYIVFELQSPSAAERIVNGIMDAVDQLADFAEAGTPLSSIADTDSDYRYLTSGNYVILYRAVGKDVFVDRVLYGHRDYLRILFGDIRDKDTE